MPLCGLTPLLDAQLGIALGMELPEDFPLKLKRGFNLINSSRPLGKADETCAAFRLFRFACLFLGTSLFRR